MAGPQKENGYTGIANELLQEIMTRNFSKRQLNILLLILRLSYGNSQKYAYIPQLNSFELCGVAKCNIKAELAYLVDAKVIKWHIGNIFEIDKNYEKWKISLIKKFCVKKWNELLHVNIKDKKLTEIVIKKMPKQEIKEAGGLQNTNQEVYKTQTDEFIKHKLSNSGNQDGDKDTRQPKESIKESIKLLQQEQQEKKSDFEIFGKYENVCLSKSQYQELLTTIMSEKVLLEIIDDFSRNLAEKKPGKLEPEFDGIQNHFVRLQSYWDYRRKNPDKFIEGFKKSNVSSIKRGGFNIDEVFANG